MTDDERADADGILRTERISDDGKQWVELAVNVDDGWTMETLIENDPSNTDDDALGFNAWAQMFVWDAEKLRDAADELYALADYIEEGSG